jgi:hypothetical protein
MKFLIFSVFLFLTACPGVDTIPQLPSNSNGGSSTPSPQPAPIPAPAPTPAPAPAPTGWIFERPSAFRARQLAKVSGDCQIELVAQSLGVFKVQYVGACSNGLFIRTDANSNGFYLPQAGSSYSINMNQMVTVQVRALLADEWVSSWYVEVVNDTSPTMGGWAWQLNPVFHARQVNPIPNGCQISVDSTSDSVNFKVTSVCSPLQARVWVNNSTSGDFPIPEAGIRFGISLNQSYVFQVRGDFSSPWIDAYYVELK